MATLMKKKVSKWEFKAICLPGYWNDGYYASKQRTHNDSISREVDISITALQYIISWKFI